MLSSPLCLNSGSHDDYLKSILSFPVLSEGDEYRLALSYAKDNCAKSRERFIQSFLRLVPGQVSSFYKCSIPTEELIAEGNIGLIKAVDKFDPEKGLRFSPYAKKYIRASIVDYFINQGNTVRLATTKAQRKIFFAIHTFETRGQHFSPEERLKFAESNGVKVCDVYDMECRSLSGGNLPYDIQDQETGNQMVVDFHVDPVSDFTSDLIAESDLVCNLSILENALNALDDRSSYIIRHRHLTEKPTPLRVLAEKFAISTERVRQIESDTIKKLKIQHFDDSGSGLFLAA